MKGSTFIQSAVIVNAKERWRFGYSKLYNPAIGDDGAFIISVSYTGKKRKYTFSVLRGPKPAELNDIRATNAVVQDDL